MQTIVHNHRFQDLSGMTFNRLSVIKWAGAKNRRTMWHCVCICGKDVVAAAPDIKSGHTQSCGCYNAERRAATNVTHGHSFAGNHTPEYRAYCLAKSRCENPNIPNFSDYGGRGIQFRFTSFQEFFAEVGFKPTRHHSIDRIKNNGHYEKGNVKWSTRAEQNVNKRSNILLTVNGETKTATEWGKTPNARDRNTIAERVKKGFCPECSVFGKQKLRNCDHAALKTNDSFSQ